jgi:hypothetical protein
VEPVSCGSSIFLFIELLERIGSAEQNAGAVELFGEAAQLGATTGQQDLAGLSESATGRSSDGASPARALDLFESRTSPPRTHGRGPSGGFRTRGRALLHRFGLRGREFSARATRRRSTSRPTQDARDHRPCRRDHGTKCAPDRYQQRRPRATIGVALARPIARSGAERVESMPDSRTPAPRRRRSGASSRWANEEDAPQHVLVPLDITPSTT